MFAQINHVAIISHQYNTLGKFYEAVFGLKSSAKGRPASAIRGLCPVYALLAVERRIKA